MAAGSLEARRPGDPNSDVGLECVDSYTLVGTHDVEMQDASTPEPVDKSRMDPERGTPGPDGSNYRVLNPEDENNNVASANGPPLRYDPIEKVWIEDYPVRTAGMPIRRATQEEIAKFLVGDPGDIGELSDPDNFEIAEFLFTLSSDMKERFLGLNKFRGQMPWSSNHMLMQDIDKLPQPPKCHPYYYEMEGNKGKQTETFWRRDGVEVLQEILGIIALRDEFHFRPERRYTSPTRENPVYSEAWRSKAMWDIQSKIPDEYATQIQYMVATDQTPLTGFCGNKKAHPIYVTIGNLPKHIRRTHSHRAVVLLGYLPVPDVDCETDPKKVRYLKWKLFNDCMRDALESLTDAERTGVEMVCADGNVRRIYPVLSASIADYPEQCKNACTIGSFCPICLVHKDKRGDLDQGVPLRDKDATLEAIEEHRREGSADFIDFGLHDQWPWWSRHTYLDIATMHSPDLLHQIHKGVFKDHLFEWVKKIIGAATLDERYQAMPQYHGVRHFKRGVSKLSRSTGREAKEMMKTFLPVVSGTKPEVIEATLALLKFSYLAHSSTLTETELCEMDQQLEIFHRCKDVFEEWLKSERGFHNLAKLHGLQHYTHAIRMLGTPDGYNTELPERLHIDLTKTGYWASSKVDGTEIEQMTTYIQRMEAIAKHRAHLNFLTCPVDFDEDDPEAELEDEDTGEDLEVGLGGELGEGCVVEKVVDEGSTEGPGESAPEQGLESAVCTATQPYYPSPEIVTSKTRSECVRIDYLIAAHHTINLFRNIATFLKSLDPPQAMVSLSPDTMINIWTSARLFHEKLPFKPLEPSKCDKLRAYPATTNNINRVRRVGHFDTVLVLAYPQKQGIHRYRAARVRAIFELPKRIHRHYPQKLVYVDWLNPFGPSSLQHFGAYSTSLSLDQAQNPRSTVIPLAAVRLTCHLGPKFNTIDQESELTRTTDIFTACKSFFLNQFGSYHLFHLLEHWEQTAHGPTES